MRDADEITDDDLLAQAREAAPQYFIEKYAAIEHRLNLRNLVGIGNAVRVREPLPDGIEGQTGTILRVTDKGIATVIWRGGGGLYESWPLRCLEAVEPPTNSRGTNG